MHNQKGFAPIIVALIFLILAGAGETGYYLMNKQSQKQTACTMDAKICLDGSSVGRTGPNCEFAACPEAKVDETADWKTYTDSIVGFTFKYPEDALEDSRTGLTFGIYVGDLNTMPKESIMGYGADNAIKDRTAISEKNPTSVTFGMPINDSLKLLNINGALAKEQTTLRELEVCDIQFTRRAIIYKDNYQITLSWIYRGGDIITNNPSYFKIDSNGCGNNEKMWKDPNIFYSDLLAGKTDAISQKWFTDFDKIISTFKFTSTSSSSVIYKKDFNGDDLTGRLYKSEDNGKTWKEILKQYKGEVIYAIDPKNSNIIYAGDVSGNMMADNMDIDLLKSTDAGNSWEDISKRINYTGTLYGIKLLSIDSNDSNIVNLIIDAQNGNIGLKSLDGGNTWINSEISETSIKVLYFIKDSFNLDESTFSVQISEDKITGKTKTYKIKFTDKTKIYNYSNDGKVNYQSFSEFANSIINYKNDAFDTGNANLVYVYGGYTIKGILLNDDMIEAKEIFPTTNNQ